MKRKLRIAVAGAGYFSRFHCDAWRRIDDVEVVAVCDRIAERGAEACAAFAIPESFTDFTAMIDAAKPDLVDIATPPATHRDFIERAAGRGIPIICQKAFCRDLAEARAAVDVTERYGVPLIVHENFRFQPWYEKAKALIDQGTLGGLYQICFRLRPGDGQGPCAYLDRQPYFQTMKRFLIHETAIHLIDTFRFLMGEIRDLYARLDRLNPAIAGEDAGIILFGFASGARGIFDGNRLADHAAKNRRLTMGEMLIEGSQASLRLDGDGRLFLRRHGANAEEEVAYAWDNRGFAGDCVFRLQRHVVRFLHGAAAPVNTGRDYLINLAIEEAAYESDRSGRRIEL